MNFFKVILFPISLIPTETVSFLCDVSSLKRGVHSTQLCDDAEMTFVLTPLIVSAFLLVLFSRFPPCTLPLIHHQHKSRVLHPYSSTVSLRWHGHRAQVWPMARGAFVAGLSVLNL